MDALNQLICNAICKIDIEKYSKEYKQQSELLVIKDFLSPEMVHKYFLPEIDNCSQYVNRVNVIGFKKSGSVSYHSLKHFAPNLFYLYKQSAMKKFVSDIVGQPLEYCPERDPHAAALYFYTEPGDHIKVHYDKSFYRGKRFTVLLGMIQDSEKSKLICYPGVFKRNLKKNPIKVTTYPGTLVVFNGDILWHEVSPLGKGEKRVILTMEFLTDTRISLANKLVSDFKDRYLYFGKSKHLETV